MSGEKKFGTSAIGFKKTDVNSYIEKILKEFEEKLKDKDCQIILLKNELREETAKKEVLVKQFEDVNQNKAKIAEVLIKAQEKSELMIHEASEKAELEKKKIEEFIEIEKQKLFNIKEEIKRLKESMIKTLKIQEHQLDELIDVN